MHLCSLEKFPYFKKSCQVQSSYYRRVFYLTGEDSDNNIVQYRLMFAVYNTCICLTLYEPGDI